MNNKFVTSRSTYKDFHKNLSYDKTDHLIHEFDRKFESIRDLVN